VSGTETPSYFSQKLWDLLPPIYRERDETGDLAAFLKVPAPTLDDLKDLADRFPEIFDVDGCEPRFLPLLARLVGHDFDPLVDPRHERRAIREAVERYRRKGTIPAIRRSLVAVGWQGEIEETFRKALRIGQRARLNDSRLPGLIYGFGVWRVRSRDSLGLAPTLRARLPFHHPAGTRVFFLDQVIALVENHSDPRGEIARLVRKTIWADARRIFVLNLSRLNSRDRLTVRGQTPVQLASVVGATTSHRPTRAAVCIARWHGRRSGLRLNSDDIGSRLVDLWIDGRKLAVCCDIAVTPELRSGRPTLRVSRRPLNLSILNRATRECRIRFRQEDIRSLADATPRSAANLLVAISWPAPPTAQLDVDALFAPEAAANLALATQWPENPKEPTQ
jgi:phage tail-like protein